ncbi:MAG: hypothetical protein ACKOXP_03995 [Flavobacteriales bacterium]
MEELNELNPDKINTKRPNFLLVISILSFVNIGVSMLTSFFGIIGGKPSDAEIETAKLQFARSQEQLDGLAKTEKVDMTYWSEILRKLEVMSDHMYANFALYNALILLVSLLALSAVYLMFTGKKLGFHLYIAYCFLYVIQSYFFTAPQDVPTFVIVLNILYGGLWAFLYSRNLKWMR